VKKRVCVTGLAAAVLQRRPCHSDDANPVLDSGPISVTAGGQFRIWPCCTSASPSGFFLGLLFRPPISHAIPSASAWKYKPANCPFHIIMQKYHFTNPWARASHLKWLATNTANFAVIILHPDQFLLCFCRILPDRLSVYSIHE